MPPRIKFLFDLDGTLTPEESIPYVARQLGIRTDRLEAMTVNAVSGTEGYEPNLRERISMLAGVDTLSVRRCLDGMPLRSGLLEFLREYSGMCVIVSSNLDCWWRDRLERDPGCEIRLSEGEESDGLTSGIRRLLDKTAVVAAYRSAGYKVVYIGDGANDVEAMKTADAGIAVAFGPSRCLELEKVAFRVVHTESDLLSLLAGYLEAAG